MKGQTVILEHVFLTGGTFIIFLMVVVSFAAINQYFIIRRTNDVLQVIAERTAVAVVTAYEEGREINSTEEPVVKLYLDLPQDIAGRPYEVQYDDSSRSLLAWSGQSMARSTLLGIPDRTELEGKITGSSGSAYVSYYRSDNRVVLGVEWR